MKTKLFAAALAAMTLLGVAAPASAQQYYDDRRGGYDQRGRDDYGRRHDDYERRFDNVITVRDRGRVMFFDRDDRLFNRLLRSPFIFRPGLVYVYTDQCRRDGQCRVLVFNRYRRDPVGRLWAPPIRRWRDREANWDRNWDWDRDWDDDNRSGHYRDHREYHQGDDYGLEGGPRRR